MLCANCKISVAFMDKHYCSWDWRKMGVDQMALLILASFLHTFGDQLTVGWSRLAFGYDNHGDEALLHVSHPPAGWSHCKGRGARQRKLNCASAFQVFCCFQFVNIPLTKSSYMVKPKVKVVGHYKVMWQRCEYKQ